MSNSDFGTLKPDFDSFQAGYATEFLVMPGEAIGGENDGMESIVLKLSGDNGRVLRIALERSKAVELARAILLADEVSFNE